MAIAEPLAEPDHPAKFSAPIVARLAELLDTEGERRGRPLRILDPFAGVGRIHRLPFELAHATVGVELEPEWAIAGGSIPGDATRLPFSAGSFDAVATSPCLEQSHRILTDDLRWVPAGDLSEGDRVLAFDESGPEGGGRGMGARRRWRRAEIVRSEPRLVECVRVILANGDELVTTPEHPWLAQRYAYGGRRSEWIRSADLPGWHVQRQVVPWTERRSFDAGWLSGMLDGEGSLSLGAHGSPKLSLCQVDGPVLDRAEELMEAFGYEPNRIWRAGVPAHRQKIGNLYVTGGFPAMLRALGELRPTRLLRKWEALPIETRTVQAEKVAVLGVEPAGRREIQEIETTAGTYFGEGYLHHNCYGNRMADLYDGGRDTCRGCDGSGCSRGSACGDLHLRPFEGSSSHGPCQACSGSGFSPSRRRTYRISLGRQLSEGSAAGLQWGPAYRDLHKRAWQEAQRVLAPGGLLLVNISNHVRGGQLQPVVEWHLVQLLRLGFLLIEAAPIETQRMGHGQNRDLRADAEHVLVLRDPRQPQPEEEP